MPDQRKLRKEKRSGISHCCFQSPSEIRSLKEKLRQLEQRVDTQSKNDHATRAKLAAMKAAPVYKGPSAFDPCPEGKVCYKGITLTFGGWIDLAGIYRSRNIASDTGSVYSAIPFPQAKNYGASESRFSARQTRFSVLAEGDVGSVTHMPCPVEAL